MKKNEDYERIQSENYNEVKFISRQKSVVEANSKHRVLPKGRRKPIPKKIIISIIMFLAVLFLAPSGCDNVNWKLDISAQLSKNSENLNQEHD